MVRCIGPGPISRTKKLTADSIQEALRIFFQPIKNGDPQLQFYSMYKRETREYDIEHIQRYGDDLNATLIFVGFCASLALYGVDHTRQATLFSAISGAFVIDIRSKLEPDSSERSEIYLRAILLSLNPSAAPGEVPMAPPAWSGPPGGIVEASNLLYASLVMSLLAAFVAMLGKQWLNRYLRHAGGSVIERCGDRQRKFDALERWPFRVFIESLPIMLQIALLLLTCGLSRYMWSVNVSVARLIISFTAFGVLYYLGILTVGTSWYECPFRMPAMMAFAYLRDAIPKLLTRLVRGIRRLRPATLLPTIAEDASHPLAPPTGPGLRVRVWNLENIQRQNADNARCVCWVLRNITDPEAIESAVRLAGTIRWFDGDSGDNPPYDLIVSIFEACFDSTKQPYPGMRDRAYFSARAILQINTRVRVQCCERASEYPIPGGSWSSPQRTDPDLRHILHILELNLKPERPTLEFPRGGTNTRDHLLWMSNLFVDMIRVGPDLTLKSYGSYLSAAVIDHKAAIANILLAWYISMGGQVEEETFWAIDKSYAMVSLPFFHSVHLKFRTPAIHWNTSSLTYR